MNEPDPLLAGKELPKFKFEHSGGSC